MINKLYEKIKSIIKENYKFFVVLIVLGVVLNIKLPYYIYAPGGLIDVSKRISIEDSYDVSGSFNLAYVLEYRATIPSIIYAYFNKNLDIYNYNEVVPPNETVEEIEFRNKMMLEEANENALYVGFKLAGESVSLSNQKVYVSYTAVDAITDLKIGDEIITIENDQVTCKNDLYEYIKKYNENDIINIKVIHDNEVITRKATLQKTSNRNVIGVILTETKDVKTSREVDINFKKSESGPSGGFMMALSIYNYLTEYDLTNGLKIVGTGTIDENGNVGSIGGVTYKIKAAVKEKASIFFVPTDNYEEAKETIDNNKYNIKLVKVNNISEAIEYLKNYSNSGN